MAAHMWTEQDEQEYAQWAATRPYAPPSDIEDAPLPIWAHGLIIVGGVFFCAAFWVGLVWLLFFRK